jgi:hypothetical protein
MTMFLVLLISVTLAICDEKHTSDYNMLGKTNDDYQYYDPRTYMGGPNEDPQKEYPSAGNTNYRKLVSKNYRCIGKQCAINADQNGWGCPDGNRKCYNAEHIIALASTEIPILKDCGKSHRDIAGNLIMAYGNWNQDMKESHINEKVEIYGADLVKSAYDAVYFHCFQKKPDSYPPELCLSAGSSPYMWIIIVLVGIVLIVCGAYYYTHYYIPQQTIGSTLLETSSDESIELGDKLPVDGTTESHHNE